MSYKPSFTATARMQTGPSAVPPNSIIFTGEPCAVWFSSGRSRSRVSGDPPIVGQVAFEATRAFDPPGWQGSPRLFDPAYANVIQFVNPVPGVTLRYSAVFAGFMWLGTPDAHFRVDITPYTPGVAPLPTRDVDAPKTVAGLAMQGGRTATFDLYRPFGAAVPTLVAAPGVLWNDPYGEKNAPAIGAPIVWTDILDCADTVDIRDGMLRNAGGPGQTYTDGDEVRFPTGIVVTRYVVVRVTRVRGSDGVVFKRCYLARDNPIWPGP